MSRNRLRSRLERLEQFDKVKRPPDRYGFKIDPQIARSLRVDNERARLLCIKKYEPGLSATETEEETRLLASIKERAAAVQCPSSYGREQQQIDKNRIRFLEIRRTAHLYRGPPMTNAEDAEEAHLTARVLALDQKLGPLTFQLPDPKKLGGSKTQMDPSSWQAALRESIRRERIGRDTPQW